jgi:hypothetical protein
MRTVVFRLLFVPDIHYTFTIGGHVYLLFQFPWEHWPKTEEMAELMDACILETLKVATGVDFEEEIMAT